MKTATRLKIAILTLVSYSVAGCGSSIVSHDMAPSYSQYQTEQFPRVACRSNLGAYALPKRYLKIEISGDGPYGIAVDADTESYPDSQAIYCLDYLHSGFGKNQIGVTRSNGLLEKIFTKFESQTNEIAKKTINAAATLASAGAAARLARSNPGRTAQIQSGDASASKKVLTFDPFDEARARQVNAELKHFGYCVYFDNRGDPRIPDWWPLLCGQHTTKSYYSYNPEQFAKEQASGRTLAKRAILYRPEISHRLVVLRKKDPGDPYEPWAMVGTEHVKLPNRAPIMALGLTRGLFADAETTITFKSGILMDVDITKPSELNALIDIPIFAINAVLSIPERTLAILQNDVDNRKALIASNANLINTLRKLDSQVQADRAIANGTGGINTVLVPSSRSNAVFADGRSGQNCLDDDEILLVEGGVELCRTVLQRGD